MSSPEPPLPSFLIIGAQKSATRWLRYNLGLHPEIFTPRYELKFFNSPIYHELGVEWYRAQFKGWTGEPIVGEATPSYMIWKHTPGRVARRIRETVPEVRLIAILLVGASGLVTAGMLLMIVFGGKLGEAIAEKAGLGSAFTWAWDLLRWPLAFVIVLLLFALIYYLAPNTDQRNWKWITPGSLVGAVMWLALSGLFALFTAFSDSYSATYGTLAGGIILLLWLNFSAWAILFGAELNAELDRQADIRAAGGPSAGLVKPARRER